MAIQQKPHSMEEFREFAFLPENAARVFELIHGEIVEVSPERSSNGAIANRIVGAVYNFCIERNLPFDTTSGGSAYDILGNTIAPDFAYKHGPMSDDYPDPLQPEWAAEVISPTDRAVDVAEKREIYLEAGILLWEIYPRSKRVDVYAPGQPPRSAGIDDVLDGGEVLPGFTVAVKDLFPEVRGS